MLIIPAIDIKNEQCVRLMQGDPERATIYSDDPVEQARTFENLGAKLIHVIDLDGAFQGTPVNYNTIRALAANISIPIEVGGGIRSSKSVEMYAEHGINRIIIGTAIFDKIFDKIIEEYSDKITIGIDARDEKVAVNGWKKLTDVSIIDCIKDLQQKGINDIIYTDITTDGMLRGPNFKSLEKILTNIKGIDLIAAGGVSSLDDIRRLKEYENDGLQGCVIGKAIYDGRINLIDAIKIAK